MTKCSLSRAMQQLVSCWKRKRGHSHWLAWGGVEEVPRSLKKETLPAAQGEVSPPAHLCCHKRGSWVPRLPEAGKAGENPSAALGSGAESTEQLPTQDTSTKAVLNAPASRTAQLECGHEPAGWGSVPRDRLREAPGHNPSLGDIGTIRC